MNLRELLIAMEIDLKTYNKNENETIQVELENGTYLDIKEVFFLDSPIRTIIRTVRKPDSFPYNMKQLGEIK